jgi:hypothetical protein
VFTSNHEETQVQHVNPDPLHGCKAAAVYIGSNTRTMANWRSQGKGPDYVKIGGVVKYRQSSLDRFIKAGEVSLGPEAA